MIVMCTHTRRPWRVGLIVGLVVCGLVGGPPVEAQPGPIIVPPISPIVVGITPGIPWVVVGDAEHSRGGLTWSRSGRADVDIDIDRHHGQATAR